MKKVLVGISGGVDSASAAAILLDAGYDVVGGFMKCWSGNVGNVEACWIEDRRDAARVCAHLGIKMIDFDYEKQYREYVVKYMINEYAKARTPNPDILCNKFVKFDLFYKDALKMNFDFIAMGHYARVRQIDRKTALMRAVDQKKDQTYFLHQISQNILSQTLFPIGEMTKHEVRAYAKKRGLDIFNKRSTRGICFVGNVALADFLKESLPEKQGNIVDVNGKILGKHKGIQFYTIGQRKGFGLALGEPYSVIEKREKTNELVVAKASDKSYYVSECVFGNANWIRIMPKNGSYRAKVRHQENDVGILLLKQKNSYKAVFDEPQKSVPPGQFLVVYVQQECLGGGVIERVKFCI